MAITSDRIMGLYSAQTNPPIDPFDGEQWADITSGITYMWSTINGGVWVEGGAVYDETAELTFPIDPSPGEIFSWGERSWVWNGVGWEYNNFARLNDAEANISQAQTNIGNLQSDVGALQSEVGGVQSDVSALQEDIASLEDLGERGTVAQLVSKSTSVDLNAIGGEITMDDASLGGTTTVSFLLTNYFIAATDLLLINHLSGGTAGAYAFNAQCADGQATINVRNLNLTSLAEAIVLRFRVIKGAI